VVRVEAGHQQLAAAPKITSTTVQVSFDDGATWQPAQLTGSGTTRYAVFSAPAGSYVSLKVTAADAAGGTIYETITRGYATAAAVASARYKTACATPSAGNARCLVLYTPQTASIRARAAGFTAAVAAPAGWGAKNIESAYRLPVSKNPHQTVAVVDAYDTPNLESYLNTYRKEYGLPPCTTANGCFRQVNQNGKTFPLAPNGTLSGWDLETTLDTDMVSAACPRCRILVVEANSRSFADLAAAENTAAKLRAVAISNSYGARENGFAQAYAGAYNHPGHTIVVSSGDLGYTAASFPANLATVTAAGGTQLSRAPNGRGYTEQVWNTSGAGAGSSGCSAYVSKPSWQHDPNCPGRTVADVSALAWDIAIYNKDYGGWIAAGGTSASAPLIAGVFGLAGNAAKARPGDVYAHQRSFFDITAGNNDWLSAEGGAACGHDYLCVAKNGYDAPAGLGSPDGTGAF
jgi:subtilase family serine protease